MALYPVFLELAGRRAVVVGGGRVAERKALALLEAGAAVVVVAPETTPSLAAAAAESQLVWHRRPFVPGDLAGAALAFAATDRREVNAAVAAEARAAGVPCNVADDPEACDFLVPALVRRGDLLIAISTGGASPAVARRVRETLEARFGPEWAPYLDLLSAVRAALLGLGEEPDRNRELFGDLADLDLLPLIRDGRWREVEAAVVAAAERRLGPAAANRFTLAALGVSAPALGVAAPVGATAPVEAGALPEAGGRPAEGVRGAAPEGSCGSGSPRDAKRRGGPGQGPERKPARPPLEGVR